MYYYFVGTSLKHWENTAFFWRKNVCMRTYVPYFEVMVFYLTLKWKCIEEDLNWSAEKGKSFSKDLRPGIKEENSGNGSNNKRKGIFTIVQAGFPGLPLQRPSVQNNIISWVSVKVRSSPTRLLSILINHLLAKISIFQRNHSSSVPQMNLFIWFHNCHSLF